MFAAVSAVFYVTVNVIGQNVNDTWNIIIEKLLIALTIYVYMFIFTHCGLVTHYDDINLSQLWWG